VTFVLLGVLLMWTLGMTPYRWLRRPNSEAQIQLHCGHLGPVVGGLGGLYLRVAYVDPQLLDRQPHCTGWRKKTGPSYLIANILKTP